MFSYHTLTYGNDKSIHNLWKKCLRGDLIFHLKELKTMETCMMGGGGLKQYRLL